MKQRRLFVVVLVILMLVVGSLVYLASMGFWNSQTISSPDIIFHNGEILTMEESPAQVEAIAIRNESILAIGDENEILAMAGSNTHIINLEGRTLLPGFIDSHSHHIGDRNIVNQSTPEEVALRVQNYREVGGRNGRFALYLCNLGATTPKENIRAAIETAHAAN